MSDDSTFGEDAFGFPEKAAPPATFDPELTRIAQEVHAKQEAFNRVASTLDELWGRLPTMTVREVDAWVTLAHRQLLDIMPLVGLSIHSLRPLKDCCGRERKWPEGLLGDPDKVLLATSPFYVPPPPKEELAWWPGDIIRRISRFFGFKYCEKCDRRRRAINKFFGQRI